MASVAKRNASFRRTSTYSKEFKKNADRRNLATGMRWWNPAILDGGSNARAQALCRDVMTICDRQQDTEALQLLHYSMAGNGAQIIGFGPNTYSRMTMESTEHIALNMVQRLCLAAKSKITKTKPKCSFETMGGDYEMRQRAEDLEKYCDGIYYDVDYYEEATMAFYDALIDGTGYLFWGIDPIKDKLTCERAYPCEVVIDDAEMQHRRKGKTLYRRRFIDRYELACLARIYQEKHGLPPEWDGDDDEDALYNAVMECEAGGDEARDVTIKATADLVLVYEGWRLPSPGEKTNTGRHVISTHAFCILDEEWEWDRFPLATTRWIEAPMGFHGVGIAEQITGLQVEINTELMEIQEGHHLVRGFVAVEAGSEVLAAHINNDLGNIVTYARGTQPPEYKVPSIIAPEKYEHMKWLVEQCYEQSRMNALTTQGEKPAGLNSGKALLTLGDLQTDVLIDPGRQYEALSLDSTDLILRWSKELAKRNPQYGITARDKRELVYIKWADVDMERDKFILQVFPTSALAASPAAKQQQVSDMIQSGLVDADTGLDLMDFPDTLEYSRRRNGWRRCVERDITTIVRKGTAVSPEPFYNIQGSIPLVRDALNDYRSRGLPEDKMELLREYLVALTRLPVIQQQLVPAQMMAPNMAPMPTPGQGPEAAGVPGAAPPGGPGGPPATAPGQAPAAPPG